MRYSSSLPHIDDSCSTHVLVLHRGLEWNTCLEGPETVCTVKDLLKELYERAGKLRCWSLVRHTAGVLRKRPDDLAKFVTDLLVLQKQLTIGMPPAPHERIIPQYVFAFLHQLGSYLRIV